MTFWGWGNDEHAQDGLGHTGKGIAKPTPAVAVNATPGVRSLHGQFMSALLHMEDGTTMGFGGKADCQLVNGRGGMSEQLPVLTPEPTLYRPAVQISARGAHSLAVLPDGTMEAGGANQNATRGDGTVEALKDIASAPFPSRVRLPADAVGRVIAAAAGDVACSALLDNGDLLSWGVNGSGDCGDGTLTKRLAPVYTHVTDVVAVARGWGHALAILTGGIVVAWGQNNRHQCGVIGTSAVTVPIAVALPRPAVAVAAAGALSLAILDNGDLYQWGYLLSTMSNVTPRRVLQNVTAVDAGCYQTTSTVLAVAGGEVWGWGQNDLHQIGDGTREPRNSPVPIGLNATAVSCGVVNGYAW